MRASHLQVQLSSRPLVNAAVIRRRVGGDKLQLSIPLNQPRWSRAVRWLLPLSKEKNLELDRLGGELLALCDGHHTVEQIIDAHKDRWQLSFFEARAMVLQFLQHLMRHQVVVLVVPSSPPGA